jgi:hypothetical protein
VGEARHGVDDEQHGIAQKELGDGHGGSRREATHRRALVAGGDDGDREGAIGRQRVIKKFAHLVTALANESDHHGVEVARTRKHREKGRFANAGAGENANALPGANGQTIPIEINRLSENERPITA